MDIKEVEALITTCLEAVSEQYVLPLTLALGTLTAVVCRDRETADAVAAALLKQAESCPADVAGRTLLQALAGLAAGTTSPSPDDVRNALRKSLKLIPGGKPPGGK